MDANIDHVLGVAPEAFLNELFNIVHCSAADLMDQFEEAVAASCVNSSVDPENVMNGVEEIYSMIVNQIEECMEIFVGVALETCFVAPKAALEDVQRRRSTVLLEPEEPADEEAERVEIEQLLMQGRLHHTRLVHAQKQLAELKRVKDTLAPDLAAVANAQSGIDSSLQNVQQLMSSVHDLQQIFCDGQKLNDVFTAKLRCAHVPSDRMGLQVEMNKKKWSRIIGRASTETAAKAWPF